jgi:hypothetical protein
MSPHRHRQATHVVSTYRDARPPVIRCSCGWQSRIDGLNEQGISAMTIIHLAGHAPANLGGHE